jgi:hypothetical protein
LARFHLGFQSNAAGEFERLTISKRVFVQSEADIKKRMKRLGNRPEEVVLGEPCTWFDMTPGMADASLAQCRTGDGIVLKDSHFFGRSYYRGDTLEAVAFQRRNVGLAEVMPPSSILDTSRWDLPE